MLTKINPCLWFDTQAEDAAKFYTSIFPDSRIVTISRYGEVGPGKAGSVMMVVFELEGQRFFGLNGGPQYRFTPAISLTINCRDQAEIDRYWEQLVAGGGEHVACGWLHDKFGLSWQVVPSELDVLLQDKDPARTNRVMAAVMKMKKLDIATLRAAYDQK